ncbi:MAG TPA: C40 family peptidase [Gammaproteobacteria bacterium]
MKIQTVLLLSCLASLAACAQWPEPSAVPAPSAQQLDLGKRAAALAQQQEGVPYQYGGHTPLGFDCSGLVYYVYGKLGVSLPRTAAAQYDHTPRVGRDDLKAGDLVFFYGGNIMHVGIYVGDGWFIHAPETGKPVAGAWLNAGYWAQNYYGAGRP